MIYFHQHFEVLLLLPSIVLQATKCENPDCGVCHKSLVLGWLFWSVEIEFN